MKKGTTWGLIVILVGLVLGALVLWQVSIPVFHQLAERQIGRGDAYLLAQDFDQARDEYRKALRYEPANSEAEERTALAEAGPVDIAQLRSFYQEHGLTAVVDKIDQAEKTYTEPKEALKAGVTFYEAGDYVYAQYPILQATKLDPDYPEAWHYLGLVYQQLAKVDSAYIAKAEDAFGHRDVLTPKYLQ